MAGPYKKKKRSHGDPSKRLYKTKRRGKDLDEIDINASSPKELDVEKPGEGKFYCNYCVRYFIDHITLEQHHKTKSHKKRIKDLQTEPYSVEESERAAGFGSYSFPKQRKIDNILDTHL